MEERTIKIMLEYIEMKPYVYLGEKENRLDYLCHFLDGWLINNKNDLNQRYRDGLAHQIYDHFTKHNCEMEFSFVWYKLIYSATTTEEEAWKVFFRLSYKYIEELESELQS